MIDTLTGSGSVAVYGFDLTADKIDTSAGTSSLLSASADELDTVLVFEQPDGLTMALRLVGVDYLQFTAYQDTVLTDTPLYEGTAAADMLQPGSVDANGTQLSDTDANRIDAAAGDDTVTGGAAADAIFLGDGADSVSAQNGADTVHGGAGDDVILGDAG